MESPRKRTNLAIRWIKRRSQRPHARERFGSDPDTTTSSRRQWGAYCDNVLPVDSSEPPRKEDLTREMRPEITQTVDSGRANSADFADAPAARSALSVNDYGETKPLGRLGWLCILLINRATRDIWARGQGGAVCCYRLRIADQL